MAKGSVRKKGKKWYFRFYLEDENGNRVQKELPGTENKSETESLLRKAMEEYENQRFVAKTINLSLGDMLDMWVRDGLNPSSRSNGTVRSYMNVVNCVKRHPIGKRKLKVVTAEHLQAYFDSLVIDKVDSDGKLVKALSSGTLHVYAAVLRGAFRFAVFPKQLITFNPMQYVVLRESNDDFELFSDETNSSVPTVSDKQYGELTGYLKEKDNPALLPIQIAYYTGLRIGEAYVKLKLKNCENIFSHINFKTALGIQTCGFAFSKLKTQSLSSLSLCGCSGIHGFYQSEPPQFLVA